MTPPPSASSVSSASSTSDSSSSVAVSSSSSAAVSSSSSGAVTSSSSGAISSSPSASSSSSESSNSYWPYGGYGSGSSDSAYGMCSCAPTPLLTHSGLTIEWQGDHSTGGTPILTATNISISGATDIHISVKATPSISIWNYHWRYKMSSISLADQEAACGCVLSRNEEVLTESDIESGYDLSTILSELQNITNGTRWSGTSWGMARAARVWVSITPMSDVGDYCNYPQCRAIGNRTEIYADVPNHVCLDTDSDREVNGTLWSTGSSAYLPDYSFAFLNVPYRASFPTGENITGHIEVELQESNNSSHDVAGGWSSIPIIDNHSNTGQNILIDSDMDSTLKYKHFDVLSGYTVANGYSHEDGNPHLNCLDNSYIHARAKMVWECPLTSQTKQSDCDYETYSVPDSQRCLVSGFYVLSCHDYIDYFIPSNQYGTTINSGDLVVYWNEINGQDECGTVNSNYNGTPAYNGMSGINNGNYYNNHSTQSACSPCKSYDL